MNTVSAPEQGTGLKTMADPAGLAAAKYADKPALRHKSGDTHEGTHYVLEHSESKAGFVEGEARRRDRRPLLRVVRRA